MAKSSRTCAMFKGLPSSKIWKQIARLNLIAGTPETAFKFDPSIRKIELFLIKQPVSGQAIGLRKFWRHNLPTLKFHNENVDFSVKHIVTETKEDIQKCPTKIIIHNEGSQVNELDCSNKHYSEILKEVVGLTKATPVPSEEIPVITRPGEEKLY